MMTDFQTEAVLWGLLRLLLPLMLLIGPRITSSARQVVICVYFQLVTPHHHDVAHSFETPTANRHYIGKTTWEEGGLNP